MNTLNYCTAIKLMSEQNYWEKKEFQKRQEKNGKYKIERNII